MPMTMEERLDHARAAINAYMQEKGEPAREGDEYEDTDVSDVIADLLHLQKALKLRDIDKTLQTARMHFEAEEEEQQEAQRITVRSNHCTFVMNGKGDIVARVVDKSSPRGDQRHMRAILNFDVEEWTAYWGPELPDSLDILDLGYDYKKSGHTCYEAAETSWRKEIAEQLLGRKPIFQQS